MFKRYIKLPSLKNNDIQINITTIFKFLSLNTLSLLIIWGAYYFSYFGLQFMVGDLDSKAFVGFIILGLVEVTGISVAALLLKKIAGIVTALRILFFIGSLSILLFPNEESFIAIPIILSLLKSYKILNYIFISISSCLYT